jgi:hypothetical protein
VSGAIICKIIMETKGIECLKSLLAEDTSTNEKMYDAIKKLTGMNRKDLNDSWDVQLRGFLH